MPEKKGHPLILKDCIEKMRERGIWLGKELESSVLHEAGEE